MKYPSACKKTVCQYRKLLAFHLPGSSWFREERAMELVVLISMAQ